VSSCGLSAVTHSFHHIPHHQMKRILSSLAALLVGCTTLSAQTAQPTTLPTAAHVHRIGLSAGCAGNDIELYNHFL
jgi:hypothetical protein